MLEPPKDVGKQRRIKESYSKNPILCAGEDSNLHALAGYATSRRNVYQFQHRRSSPILPVLPGISSRNEKTAPSDRLFCFLVMPLAYRSRPRLLPPLRELFPPSSCENVAIVCELLGLPFRG